MDTLCSLTTVVLMLCLLAVPVHAWLTEQEVLASYEEVYKKWEYMYRNHTSYGNCQAKDCLKLASDKADELANTYEGFDKHYANMYPVMVVNLFTREYPKLYSHVNKHLLLGSEDKVLQVYSGLLSTAISILSPFFDFVRVTVFRGQPCHYAISKKGEPFRFGRFLSTSLAPDVALKFALSAACGTFIQLDNVIGLPMRPFSAFPGEEEILLDNNALFHVQNNLNDSAQNDVVTKDEIFHQMRKIFPSASMADLRPLLPDVFVHLVMSNTTSVLSNNQPDEDDGELRYRRSDKVQERGYSFADRQAVNDLIKEDEAWKEYTSNFVY